MDVHNPVNIIDQLPQVSIKSLPEVAIHSLPSVAIQSLPSVTIANQKDVQTVEQKSPEVHGLGDLTLDGTSQSIAANPKRKGLILQSPETNQGEMVVQGFLRLASGAVVEFPAANAVTIQGKKGDVLHIGERR